MTQLLIDIIIYYSDDKGKSRLIREEDHDRSDDDDSQDRSNRYDC